MKYSTMDFPRPKNYAPLSYTDEDSLPAESIPQPLVGSAIRAETASELDISMTPEKLGCGILKRPDYLKLGGRKAKRRQVRFHLSDLRETGSVFPTTDFPRVIEKTVDNSVSMTAMLQNKKPAAVDSYGESNTTPLFALTETKPALHPEAMRLSNDKTLKFIQPLQQMVPLQEIHSGVGGVQSCTLSTPEYNTSLALGQEVMNAAVKDFDVKRAVEEHLKKSFITRQSMEGKVAEGMNIPKDQQLFRGLVSLDVSVEQVLSSAVQKIQLAKPKIDSKKESITEAPDIMMFYNPSELFWEMPYLTIDGLPPLRRQAQVKPRQTVFDMYRKLQEWDA